MDAPIIYWFRQDLRTHDLPGLAAAVATGRPLLACYILDDGAASEWRPGGASRWWLHHSLVELDGALQDLGGRLLLRRGDSAAALAALVAETGATAVYCSGQCEPWALALEGELRRRLGERGCRLSPFPGVLLFEPGSVLNRTGLPYRVFTPFWRACRAAEAPAQPQAAPGAINWYRPEPDAGRLEDWGLLPRSPDWAAGWQAHWRPGQRGAQQRLAAFLDGALSQYAEGRDHPALETTSRLSPHLHFGEISVREVWQRVRAACAAGPGGLASADKFLGELGWREFAHHLLYHFPELPERPFKPSFEAFPWLGRQDHLRAWQRGQTGYPVVDAGMRELWQTGFMHNRVRMIAASFLSKHLLTHWRAGAAWFHDTLVDADLANNSCGWQWVAGSGADAAPYFRIFNPVAQGEKFDRQGHYVRRWVPELARLPDRYLHRPWQAPAAVLREAGVAIGASYPPPLVDHAEARASALAAYGAIKGA